MLELPVRLKASTTFAPGQIVGEILGTTDVQHFHVTAALTAGTYTASDGVNTSLAIQWNAAAADVQAALNAAVPGPIIYNVTGGPLFGAGFGDFLLTRQTSGVQAILTVTPTGITGGTLSVTQPTVGTAPAGGTYGPYASGNSDGTQNPTGILRYGATTDALGNITLGGDYAVTYLTAPMAYRGDFFMQELVGLDANAVTKLVGHIIEGAVGGNGILHIG